VRADGYIVLREIQAGVGERGLGGGRRMTSSSLLLSLMRYKKWADAELMAAVSELPVLADAPEGIYVTAVIRHFHTVDCIFKAHLLGVPHGYTSANPSEPAMLPELRQRVAEIDDWYVEYVHDLDERDLEERLHVRFTDGQSSVMTRSDILLHVSLHGTYHRGNVGILLRKIGAEPPRDGFTTYLGEQCGAREQLL
jgi:uncharacterized damage-inducible protein DinB